ncbi:MAG: hypothetical protein LBO81_05080 [Clostridiales Family XIII bacterium]|jgi:hypothetical protein|nr:hypothetical protein [Clostridiales Family XIII bacterium]
MDENNRDNFAGGANPGGANYPQNSVPGSAENASQGNAYDPNAGYAQNTGYPPAGGGYANAGYAPSGDGYAQGGYAPAGEGYAQGGYGPNDGGQYVPPGQYPYNPYVAEVPPEIKKWNWGAFMYSFMWGIGNHAYLALICLIPCFGTFVWPFVCGAIGNQWAWKSGEFKDVETFLAVQKTWSRAGIVGFIIVVGFTLLYIILIAVIGSSLFSLFSNLGSSYSYY